MNEQISDDDSIQKTSESQNVQNKTNIAFPDSQTRDEMFLKLNQLLYYEENNIIVLSF